MIYIIRHGKTQMNKDNRLQGRSDMPLIEEGLEQVKQLESRLHDIEFSYVLEIFIFMNLPLKMFL